MHSLLRRIPAGITGLGIVWLAVAYSLAPLGVTPDSVNYAHAARSLAQEGTLLRFGGTPYTTWPPLYPTLLAGLLYLLPDVDSAAKALNLLAYLLSGIWAWGLFRDHFSQRRWALFFFGLVMGGYPMLWVHLHLWSEPLFIALTVGFFRYALRYLRSGRTTDWWIATLLVAMATLQRYIGVVWWGWWVFLQWQATPSPPRKWRRAGAALLFGGLPLIGWLARNYFLVGRWTGGRAPATTEPIEWLLTTAYTLAQWILPISKNHPTLSLILVGGAIILWGLTFRRATTPSTPSEKQIWAAILAYLAFLGISSFLTAVDAPRHRLLAPIYPLVMFGIGRWLERQPNLRRRFAAILLTANLAWGIAQLSLLTLRGHLGLYTHPWWRTHWLIEWYRQNAREHARYYSNFPEAFFINVPEKPPPALGWHRTARLDTVGQGTDTLFLLWFHAHTPSWIQPLDSLRQHLPMEKITEDAYGSLWKVSPHSK